MLFDNCFESHDAPIFIAFYHKISCKASFLVVLCKKAITGALMSGTSHRMARAVEQLLRQGKSQYFMAPLVVTDSQGIPIGPISDRDAVIFCCRRGEREVQLTRAFVEDRFHEFPVKTFSDLAFVTMTRYHEMFAHLPTAFPPMSIPVDSLGEVISKHNLKQLRISESEKFAHVTFFLNGGRNSPFAGEDRIRIPSIRGIPFDQAPALRSQDITEAVQQSMQEGSHAFIAANFPNGDIIGHLDNFDAKIKCAEVLDLCLGRIVETARQAGYWLVVTADHGQLERGYRSDGFPSLNHTSNPVPFIVMDPEGSSKALLQEGGSLSDVAPTILDLMALPKPEVMTGRSLVDGLSPSVGFRPKLVLIILDGWGIGQEDSTNPIYLAHTPILDSLRATCPHTALKASGEAVGLLKDRPGNSEAGHMNMGAGRIMPQDDIRIALALQDGSFQQNPAFIKAITHARKRGSCLHLITMLSNRSSHGSLDYPLALLQLARAHELTKVYVHVIFNRPSRTESAPALLCDFEAEMKSIGIGQIASGVGRGYALDRDGDFQKTKLAYDAFVYGIGTAV
jgi:2,3-bisphosphoglycerate-independent phosphoglycerate mutase